MKVAVECYIYFHTQRCTGFQARRCVTYHGRKVVDKSKYFGTREHGTMRNALNAARQWKQRKLIRGWR